MRLTHLAGKRHGFASLEALVVTVACLCNVRSLCL